MVADKPRNTKSIVRTTEYGYYIRKKLRKGDTRRQKTTKIKRNPEKVVLGKLGDMEFYAYPFQFPDKIFFGIYPLSTYIEEHQIEDFFRLYNKIKWYFKEEWTKKPKRSKKANVARKAVSRAYTEGLNKLKKANVDRDFLN